MKETHQRLIEQIKQADADFCYTEFEELIKWTCKWAIEIKSSFNGDQLDKLRLYASADLFNHYVSQTNEIRRKYPCVVVSENVVVKEAYLSQFIRHADSDEIRVRVIVRYDWRKVVRGQTESQTEIEQEIELIYIRYKKSISAEQENEGMTYCENCGFPIDATNEDACLFCDYYFMVKYDQWLLHDVIVKKDLPFQ